MNNITLLILDGWGYAPSWGGNAISQAETPNFDKFWRTYPHATLGASGTDVGLPGHEAGNSEVGHLNIGAGRVVYEDVSRIDKAINDKSFFSNAVLIEAINHAKKNGSKLHLMGLVSNGSVHSHIDHLFALLELVKQQGLNEVYIHAFTDGRDTDPQSSLLFISQLERKIKELGIGKIATISGRYYAMDRDGHWDRTQLAYQAMVDGKGFVANKPLLAISQSYVHGVTDEFIKPTVITENNQPVTRISHNDSVIFFNFRSDRARQITRAFKDRDFKFFPRKRLNDLYFVSMIPYGSEQEIGSELQSAFDLNKVKMPLAEVISNSKLKQFHVAETEKYAHVTYFFNGGRETPLPGEDLILVPSPRVPTYDIVPEMSAKGVAKNTILAINSHKYSLIVTNFANPDMVAHTGILKATIIACETIDKLINDIYLEIKKSRDILIITADHGNAEEILSPKSGQTNTEHSSNPVPFILIDARDDHHEYSLYSHGVLADIAPTILKLLNIPKPPEMTGESLIR